jgi:hypothetical protein
MNEIVFRTIVTITAAVTVLSMFADEWGVRTLPNNLRMERELEKQRIIDKCNTKKWLYVFRIGVVIGYFASLFAMEFFLPYSRITFAACTIGWSVISTSNAPTVYSRISVPFYEMSLILNGVVLTLCFCSPIANNF